MILFKEEVTCITYLVEYSLLSSRQESAQISVAVVSTTDSQDSIVCQWVSSSPARRLDPSKYKLLLNMNIIRSFSVALEMGQYVNKYTNFHIRHAYCELLARGNRHLKYTNTRIIH